MNLAKSTALVTGGASGLGAATATRLVKNGSNIVICDLNESLGKDLVAKLGPKARFAQTDVTNEESVGRAVDLAWKEFGGLHGVVNCAGVGTPEKLINKEGLPHSLDSFNKVIKINLIGTFNVTRLAVASMLKNNPQVQGERGVIVNTASVAAFEGQIGQIAYSASKGGIVAMGLPLARELAAHGIRVMTIAPGIFETPMLAGLPEKAKASLGQQVPFPPRLGRPDEYASLVQHIFENEMLNGEVIRLDGAIRMAPR